MKITLEELKAKYTHLESSLKDMEPDPRRSSLMDEELNALHLARRT